MGHMGLKWGDGTQIDGLGRLDAAGVWSEMVGVWGLDTFVSLSGASRSCNPSCLDHWQRCSDRRKSGGRGDRRGGSAISGAVVWSLALWPTVVFATNS